MEQYRSLGGVHLEVLILGGGRVSLVPCRTSSTLSKVRNSCSPLVYDFEFGWKQIPKRVSIGNFKEVDGPMAGMYWKLG